jgi:hypothetical protein
MTLRHMGCGINMPCGDGDIEYALGLKKQRFSEERLYEAHMGSKISNWVFRPQ